MQFNLEKLEKNFVILEVHLEVEEVEESLQEGYKKVVTKVSLPGFRKGHIPRKVLEKQFGKEVFNEEALNLIVPKSYTEAVRYFALEPIDYPQFEIDEATFGNGQAFVYKATVEILPEVELGQYKGLEVEKEITEISEEKITNHLETMRERHAELVLSDKESLEKGDYAVIDFEGYIDGKPFYGGASQNYSLEIGSGSFIPGFEDQMLGMKVAEKRDIQVAFPEEYHAEELAGKEATFKVELKEIKVKELPVIDDEFASTIGDFSNLEELKEDVRKKLEGHAESENESKYSQAIVDKIVENSQVLTSETLVKRELEEMVQNFEHSLEQQNLSIEKYLSYTNKTMDQMKEEIKPEAERRVKTNLVITSIARIEEIKILEDELDERINELANYYNHSNVAELKKNLIKNGRINDIEQSILFEKTADFIKEQTTPIMMVKENAAETVKTEE